MPAEPLLSDAALVSVADVLGTAAKTKVLDQLREFYERIYRAAFPDKEEAEDFAEWLAVLTEKGDAGYTLHPELLVSAKDGVIAGLMWEHYERSNAVLATYLATDASVRRHGAARLLVGAMAAHARAGSKAWGGNPIIYAELRDPKRAPPKTLAEDTARLTILDRLGFRLLDCAYLQPPLEPGGPYCDHLRLACLPSGEQQQELPAAGIMLFLDDFFACLAKRTRALPSDEWRAMMARLKSSRSVALLPLATLMPQSDRP